MKKKIIYTVLSLAFWALVWEISAKFIKADFIFPSFTDTIIELSKLMLKGDYWTTISLSLLRIVFGFVIGIVLGTILGILSFRFSFINTLLTPLMNIIKSTPVASFILLLWVIIGRANVPSAISALMVAPMIYYSVISGLINLDKKKSEVLEIFCVPKIQKIKIFVFPSVFQSIIPVLINASGFAWKAGIAAEIIAYTKNSIGEKISDAKAFFEGPALYAWTLSVILLSIIIEYLIKYYGRKAAKYVSSHE